MLKEGIAEITRLAEAAQKSEILTFPGAPHHHLVLRPGQVPQTIEANPAPRAHTARDLSAVVAFARRFQDLAAIWFHRGQVAAILDDKDIDSDTGSRTNRITLPLTFSVPLQQLQAWETHARPLQQAALVLLLRTVFCDCLGPSGQFLEIVRSVKFSSQAQGQSDLGHGKASLGKSIQLELTGTKNFPEYVELEVPIFANAFAYLTRRVLVAVEPDPGSQSFTLIPIPGQVERAIATAEAKIGEEITQRLTEAEAPEVPIYYGSP